MQNVCDCKKRLLQGKRVLLFAQFFFGYEIKIAEKLRQFGASVTLYDERSITKPFEKALLKLSPSFFRGKTEKYFDAILAKEKDSSFDYVLFVDCEMVSQQTLLKIRESYPKAKLCLYLWDSLHNLKGVQSKINLFDHVSSFDRTDSCNNSCIHFRPLFFCDDYRRQNSSESVYRYDIAFVGTIHSDRYRIIRKMQDKVSCFYVYPYLQSRFMFFYYWLTKKEYRGSAINDFQYEKLGSKEISEIVDQSKAILDIQHPKQTGLTMRTIEMLGMKKKIITTNTDIANYDFYNANNICIIDREHIQIPDGFLSTGYKDIPDEIYEYYSIDQWVLDVLGVE